MNAHLHLARAFLQMPRSPKGTRKRLTPEERVKENKARSRERLLRYRARKKTQKTEMALAHGEEVARPHKPGSRSRACYQASKLVEVSVSNNKDCTPQHQVEVLKTFLNSPTLTSIPGTDHVRPKVIRAHDIVFQHLRESMSVVKMTMSDDNMKCRHAVVNSMTGQGTVDNRLQRTTASLMGLNHKNIIRSLQSRVLASCSGNLFSFLGPPRVKRADSLTPEC